LLRAQRKSRWSRIAQPPEAKRQVPAEARDGRGQPAQTTAAQDVQEGGARAVKWEADSLSTDQNQKGADANIGRRQKGNRGLVKVRQQEAALTAQDQPWQWYGGQSHLLACLLSSINEIPYLNRWRWSLTDAFSKITSDDNKWIYEAITSFW